MHLCKNSSLQREHLQRWREGILVAKQSEELHTPFLVQVQVGQRAPCRCPKSLRRNYESHAGERARDVPWVSGGLKRCHGHVPGRQVLVRDVEPKQGPCSLARKLHHHLCFFQRKPWSSLPLGHRRKLQLHNSNKGIFKAAQETLVPLAHALASNMANPHFLRGGQLPEAEHVSA